MTNDDIPDVIEITPEMETAGAKVICDWHPQAMDWVPRQIASEVFQAMLAAANYELRRYSGQEPVFEVDKIALENTPTLD